MVRWKLCDKCGTGNPDDALYCSKCGANIETSARPAEELEKRVEPDVSVKKMEPIYYEEKVEYRMAGFLGTLSAGAILIIIALMFIRYPIDFTLISDYFGHMVAQNAFIKPPTVLFDPAVFFFAVGLWSLILAAVRFALQRNALRAVWDIVIGFFLFFVAFLISKYAVDVLTWQIAVAYFLLVLGVLIVVRWVIDVTVHRRLGLESDKVKNYSNGTQG